MPDDIDKIQQYWDNEFESHTYQACTECPYFKTWREAHGEYPSACLALEHFVRNIQDARCLQS